ncbi:MAG: hypothetical protein IPK53_04850 [bacterium]|nr:hypothetical protein [bacterium]
MHYFLLLVLAFAAPLAARDVPADWQTLFERSHGRETSDYGETVAFCRRLAATSDWLDYRSFGVSAGGLDMPVLVGGGADPAKPLIFVLAGIHPGEIDGKDAGLIYLRELVQTDQYRDVRDKLRIAFVPIFNVDGHELRGEFHRINQIGPHTQGRRTTLWYQDLNRDWLKADTPEMRAMIALIDELDPAFLLDIHVTDGAEYDYVISWGLNTAANELPAVRGYSRDVYLPSIQKRMAKRGYDFAPYALFQEGPDAASGWVRPVWEPRFSTGFGGVLGRPFLLIETHGRKPFPERVEATRVFFEETLALFAAQPQVLLDMARTADRQAESLADSLRAAQSAWPLDLELTGDSVMVGFKGRQEHKRWSEFAGDSILTWSSEPWTRQIPLYEQARVTHSAVPPLGYVIPRPWWIKVRDVIQAHGLPALELDTAVTITVETYLFDSVTFAATPYESHFRTTAHIAKTERQQWRLPQGSVLIPLNHRKALRVLNLLEPDGPDSFVQWGFLPSIFEQKEGGDADILDTLAQSMVRARPELMEDFQRKLASDTAFARSPDDRLNYWYKQSVYWDDRTNRYPIGRIVDKDSFRRAVQACGIQL